MKLELKHFQKVKSEKDHTIMMHPKGHKIHVMHEALSEDEKKVLHSLPFAKMEHKRKPEGYAKGGSVEEQLGTAERGYVSSFEPVSVPMPPNIPDLASSIAGPLSKTTSKPISTVNSDLTPSLMGALPTVRDLRQTPAESPRDISSPSQQDNPIAQAAGLAPSLEAQSLAEGLNAIYGNIKPQQGEFAAKEKAYKQAASQQEKLLKESIANKDQYDTQMSAALEDAKKYAHVNPDRYIEQMKGGKGVMTAIGMLVSGLGGNTGDNNSVIKFIDQQIQNDIKAQEKDFDNRDTLIKRYTEVFGNKQKAIDFAQALSSNMVANVIQQIGAKSGNAQVQNNAMLLASQFTQWAAEKLAASSLKHAMLSQTSQGAEGSEAGFKSQLQAFRQLDPARAKEMESRYIPGVGIASKPIAEKAVEQIAARKSLNNQIQELIDFANKNSGSVNLKVVNEGKALAAQVQDAYRRANGQGVFREAESNFVKTIIDSDPTKFFKNLRTVPKYQQALKVNNIELQNLYKAHGVEPFKGQSLESPGSQQPVKGADGRMYVRQGNFMVPVK